MRTATILVTSREPAIPLTDQTLALDTVPVPCLGARRRRVQGAILIIAGSNYVEVDERLDAVFYACDGRRSIAEIAERLAQQCGYGAGEAVAATIAGVLILAEQDLVEIPAAIH